jgi:hypothetical protein
MAEKPTATHGNLVTTSWLSPAIPAPRPQPANPHHRAQPTRLDDQRPARGRRRHLKPTAKQSTATKRRHLTGADPHAASSGTLDDAPTKTSGWLATAGPDPLEHPTTGRPPPRIASASVRALRDLQPAGPRHGDGRRPSAPALRLHGPCAMENAARVSAGAHCRHPGQPGCGCGSIPIRRRRSPVEPAVPARSPRTPGRAGCGGTHPRPGTRGWARGRARQRE